MSHGKEEHHPSYYGVFLTVFAGGLLILSGLILLVYGMFGLSGDIGRSTEVPFHIGPRAWAVLHVLGGMLLVVAGWNVFVGRVWARAFGIAIAGIVIVGSLILIEAYTFWAVGLILLNTAIIWALMRRDLSESL